MLSSDHLCNKITTRVLTWTGNKGLTPLHMQYLQFIYDKSNFEKKHNIIKMYLHKMTKGISHDLFGTEKEVCNFLSTDFNYKNLKGITNFTKDVVYIYTLY